MGNKMTLADCVRLAEFAHFHQTDKAGAPYIDHPKRVLANVQAQGAQPYVQMAAILHDVTEDTAFTPQMLLDLGVPEAAVEIVKLLDRGFSAAKYNNLKAGCSYNDRQTWTNEMWDAWRLPVDEFYYYQIRQNIGATIVKNSDIGDNRQPWRLVYLSAEQQAKLDTKYNKALALLND